MPDRAGVQVASASLPDCAASARADVEAVDRAMALAIGLGAAGLGQTSPNPSVGAVILDSAGVVAGQGHTCPAGGPHAEVVALRQAGERARGGTAVVTLEPCDHTGRTGPCSQALIQAGVARVVVALREPTPEAAGGLDTLRAAGIEVSTGMRASEAAHGLRYWLTAVGRGRPYVIWKYAATLDGRSAAADGTSQWITSEPARADVHALRATVDAIIAGVGTVLADDARLTVRVPGLTRHPLRVVVDSTGRTPPTARVFDGPAPTLVATAESVGASAGGQVDLAGLMEQLFHRGVRAALLEGGPRLAGAFLRAELVDEVIAYLAPTLLGAGSAALGPSGVGSLAQAHRLEVVDVARVGPDVRITSVTKGRE